MIARVGRKAGALVLTCVLCLVSTAQAHEDADEEIVEATRSLEANPGDPAAYVWRAELRRLAHDWAGAQKDLDNARRVAPRRDDLALCQAALDLDRGRPAAAAKGLGRYLASHRDDSAALRLRARAWNALGRRDDEVADLAALLARSRDVRPDDVRDLVRAIRADGGSVDDAIAVFDRGIQRLGSLVTLEIPAMELEADAGRFDAALARLDRVAPQYERRTVVLERRASILMRAGRIPEARAARAASRAERETPRDAISAPVAERRRASKGVATAGGNTASRSLGGAR